MQFRAESKQEYISTIKAILYANIYETTSMVYAFDITDEDTINKIPNKYPCIVSIEFEEFETTNKCFAFQACSFIYLDNILLGSVYQDKLTKLDTLEYGLSKLEKERDTSGVGFPLEEITHLEEEISKIEKQIF